MYVCMHVCVCVCVCVCASDFLLFGQSTSMQSGSYCVGVDMSTHICMHMCVCVCVCVCMRERERERERVKEQFAPMVACISGVNVPTVQIVVEGGIDTMRAVRESIRMCIPVVVIDGTGRTADLIASAFSLTRNVTEYVRNFCFVPFDVLLLL